MPADIPSGNGIVAARPEGMTAEDAARGEPAAAQGTVSLESLDRVRRAAGEITAARREQRRDGDLVATNDENKQGAHERNLHDRRLRRRSGIVGPVAGKRRSDTVNLQAQLFDEGAEFGELQPVRRRPCVDDDVHRRRGGQQHHPTELAQSPFQRVPLDRGPSMLRDHEAHSSMGKTQKGSDHPDVEMSGSEPLPCSCDSAKLSATCDAASVLERRCPASCLTRRRTCSATGP